MKAICLSLHAMLGKPQSKAIQLRTLVKNQALVILVELGSSHTFLNSHIANKPKVVVTPIPHMSIKDANGELLSCTTKARDLSWWIQGHTSQVDAKIIDMGAYDLVLGIDWLEQFRPMTCDCDVPPLSKDD
jgi:hypothetical protein